MYELYLEVDVLNIIEFEANFTGSEHIHIRGYGDVVRKVSKDVQPRVLTLIAQIQLKKNWTLKALFHAKRKPISIESQKTFIQMFEQRIENLLKNVEITLKIQRLIWFQSNKSMTV